MRSLLTILHAAGETQVSTQLWHLGSHHFGFWTPLGEMLPLSTSSTRGSHCQKPSHSQYPWGRRATLFSASQLLPVLLQWLTRFSLQAHWTSSNSPLPMDICPVLCSPGSLFNSPGGVEVEQAPGFSWIHSRCWGPICPLWTHRWVEPSWVFSCNAEPLYSVMDVQIVVNQRGEQREMTSVIMMQKSLPASLSFSKVERK